MTALSMEIRFLSFIGPKKKPAILKFGHGLNLIFGPSNTGKSSVLDALDFMFARERVLKEVPEHEGYEQIFLGVEFSNDEKFTFIRNITGGNFECFEGLCEEKPTTQKPIILKPKNKTKQIDTISNFIFKKINMNDKKLKKSVENVTVGLTLRNFLPLAIVTETNIQKEGSPYIGEQVIHQTEHKSRLKLLLTGVDDSSLLPAEIEKVRFSRTAKIDILEELITEQENNIPEGETIEELEDQKERLLHTIQKERTILDSSEEHYNSFVCDRTKLRNRLEKNKERLDEISEMLSRFKLLKIQYKSDIRRLENIGESGLLIDLRP